MATERDRYHESLNILVPYFSKKESIGSPERILLLLKDAAMDEKLCRFLTNTSSDFYTLNEPDIEQKSRTQEAFPTFLEESELFEEGHQNCFDSIVLIQSWGQNKITVYNLIAKYWKNLKENGSVLLVLQKKFGAKSIIEFLKSKNLDIEPISNNRSGLRLMKIYKNQEKFTEIVVSQEISFNFRNHSYSAYVASGAFSKTDLDNGTRFLLEITAEKLSDMEDKVILDMGAGWGAITIVLDDLFPGNQFISLELDRMSLEVLRKNLDRLKRTSCHRVDLTNKRSYIGERLADSVDYIVSNPPFHMNDGKCEVFFEHSRRFLKREGSAFFVVESTFSNRFRKHLERFFKRVDTFARENYVVFMVRRE